MTVLYGVPVFDGFEIINPDGTKSFQFFPCNSYFLIVPEEKYKRWKNGEIDLLSKPTRRWKRRQRAKKLKRFRYSYP